MRSNQKISWLGILFVGAVTGVIFYVVVFLIPAERHSLPDIALKFVPIIGAVFTYFAALKLGLTKPHNPETKDDN